MSLGMDKAFFFRPFGGDSGVMHCTGCGAGGDEAAELMQLSSPGPKRGSDRAQPTVHFAGVTGRDVEAEVDEIRPADVDVDTRSEVFTAGGGEGFGVDAFFVDTRGEVDLEEETVFTAADCGKALTAESTGGRGLLGDAVLLNKEGVAALGATGPALT